MPDMGKRRTDPGYRPRAANKGQNASGANPAICAASAGGPVQPPAGRLSVPGPAHAPLSRQSKPR